MVARPSLIEPELTAAELRGVELTRAGARELLLALLPTLACFVVGSWVFLTKPLAVRTPLGAAVFASFFVIGLYLVMRVLTVWERRLELVRKGKPASAVVVSTAKELTGLERYRAWYPAEDGERSVDAVSWPGRLAIGDAVTVLYMPGRPERALIYPLAGCTARDSREIDAAEQLGQSPLSPKI